MAGKKPKQGSEAGESDVKRQMREALEAKKARAQKAHGEEHGARGMGLHTNDKSTRQFRRKAGG